VSREWTEYDIRRLDVSVNYVLGVGKGDSRFACVRIWQIRRRGGYRLGIDHRAPRKAIVLRISPDYWPGSAQTQAYPLRGFSFRRGLTLPPFFGGAKPAQDGVLTGKYAALREFD
jgi:hypothetical protein